MGAIHQELRSNSPNISIGSRGGIDPDPMSGHLGPNIEIWVFAEGVDYTYFYILQSGGPWIELPAEGGGDVLQPSNYAPTLIPT